MQLINIKTAKNYTFLGTGEGFIWVRLTDGVRPTRVTIERLVHEFVADGYAFEHNRTPVTRRVQATPRKQANSIDRSTADHVLLDVLPEADKQVDIFEWSRTITAFLAAWYMSDSKDMHEFGRRWAAERAAAAPEPQETGEAVSEPQEAAEAPARATSEDRLLWTSRVGVDGVHAKAEVRIVGQAALVPLHGHAATYTVEVMRVIELPPGKVMAAREQFLAYDDELDEISEGLPAVGELATFTDELDVQRTVMVITHDMYVQTGLAPRRYFRRLREDDPIVDYPRRGVLAVLIVGPKLGMLARRERKGDSWTHRTIKAMAMDLGQAAVARINYADGMAAHIDDMAAHIDNYEDLYLTVVDPAALRPLEA